MKRYLPVSEGKRLNICVFACISTQKTVSLHDVNNKLKEESQIFKIKFISEDKQKRSLGANAARLVTRMPFKEIENLG